MQASVRQVLVQHASLCAPLHDRYPLLNMARVHHVNTRGEPMSYADKPFLVPLAAQLPDLESADFCKATQIGISELLILLMLYNSGWRDRICAYILPQYQTSNRFVDRRIDPLLLNSPAYAERTAGAALGDESGTRGSLRRKRFGKRGWMLFLSSQTESDFLEFTCDTAIIDEYDQCDLTNVARVQDRLRESPHPQLFRVSNPSESGVGAHRLWLNGSQSRWYQRCVRCGERQPLDWFINMVSQDDAGRWIPRDTHRAHEPGLGDLRPVCRRCGRPWEMTHQGCGWVAEAPGGDRPAFHMSRLDTLPSRKEPQPMRRLFAQWVASQGDAAQLKAFYKGALGWPYVPPGSQITLAMLQLAMTDQPANDWTGGPEYEELIVVMGIDVGTLLHIAISVLAEMPDGTIVRRGRLVCTIASFEELHDMVKRFRVDVAVIDWQPETRKAKEFRDFFTKGDALHEEDWHDCSVWLCKFWPRPRAGVEWGAINMDYAERMVTVDRTQVFDHTLLDLKEGRKKFPGDAGTVLGFTDQMQAPVRRPDGETVRWDEAGKPDHFRLADVYERVAMEIYARQGVYF